MACPVPATMCLFKLRQRASGQDERHAEPENRGDALARSKPSDQRHDRDVDGY